MSHTLPVGAYDDWKTTPPEWSGDDQDEACACGNGAEPHYDEVGFCMCVECGNPICSDCMHWGEDRHEECLDTDEERANFASDRREFTRKREDALLRSREMGMVSNEAFNVAEHVAHRATVAQHPGLLESGKPADWFDAFNRNHDAEKKKVRAAMKSETPIQDLKRYIAEGGAS